jgi:hypothetical protein
VYLNARSFNGYSLWQLRTPLEEVKPVLRSLLQDELININFGDRHENAAILAFEPESTEMQLEKLETDALQRAYIYPSKSHLVNVVNQHEYSGLPFTLKLALGEPRLKFYSFELKVLEWYRNDPRYMYQNDDIEGLISVNDEYFESSTVKETDKIVLQTYGFSYTPDLSTRAVAVMLWYLSRLSAEHQQIWNANLLEDKFIPHPEYQRAVLGEFPENISVHAAFIEELYHINKMCEIIGWPTLFRENYEDNKPANFTFLIRPTASEFADYVLTLDHMMSENLNKDFFRKDLVLEREVPRKDGKIVVEQKGTIQLLEEWITTKFRISNMQQVEKCIEAFRVVRRLRQKPAHTIQSNTFDQKYIEQQRDLIFDAYNAIRILRLLISKHSKVLSYDIPEYLVEGKIVVL